MGAITRKWGHMTLQETLRTHDFARGLTESQISVLAGMAQFVTFEEDDVILEADQRSASFYLLVSGSVAVELRTPAYVVLVEALGPGKLFGWSALLDHQDTLFQVRSREHTTALRLDGAHLRAACEADSQLGNEVRHRALQVVARRVRATEIRFAEMCGVRV
jgi:CRP-like cAMP-binding protein